MISVFLGWTPFFIEVGNTATMPTCSKNAQAKPTEDGSEGGKSLTSDLENRTSPAIFFIKNIKLVRVIKKS